MPPPPSFIVPPVAERPARFGQLLGASLRRPGGRRALSILSVVLLLAGVGLFAYPFATNLYQQHLQGSLKKQFSNPSYSVQYKTNTIKVGDGLTELIIPKIDQDVVVVQGTTVSALKAGAGHYVGTPLPGQKGNVAIAGHRTTYGRPFNRLDEMKPGDIAMLKTPGFEYTYVVVPNADFGPVNPHPVSPSDTTVVDKVGDGSEYLLTLTTCNPKGSAAQRLILRLKLDPTRTKTLPVKG